MKKANKKSILSFLPILAALLIFITMFLPAIVAKEPSGSVFDSISGTWVSFGHTENLLLGITVKINMNMFALVGYFLPLVVAIIALVLDYLNKNSLRILVKILFLGSFVVTAIALFTVLSTKITSVGTVNTFADLGEYNLGIGSILGAVFAILGFASVTFDLIRGK